MFTIERQNEIIALLKFKKSVTVKELAKKFYISEATVRRDLDKLQKQGVLQKTHGGAVLLAGLDTEIPLSVRETEQKIEKEIIGRLAANLVNNNSITIMDSSTTTLRVVPHLKNKKNIVVITNGAKTAVELGEFLHTEVYCTGGKFRENSLSFIGEIARDSIDRFSADIVFFSCRALSNRDGLYDTSPEEAELRKHMISRSKKIVLLCDHTKFGDTSFYKISDFADIDIIVTNKKPSRQWVQFLDQNDIELIFE